MRIEDVPLDCIKVPKDRRKINHEKVKSLAASIKVIGLRHAIGLTDAYELCYGGHRLEAVKLNGSKTITATFVEAGDLADLAEADENLQRHNLDALEFAQATKQRKDAWERIHGPTTRGPKPSSKGVLATVAKTSAEFEKETAEVAGVSTRTVRQAAEIGAKLTDEAAAVVADTPIADSPTKLKAIADKPKSEQVKAAKAAVAESKKPKPPKAGSQVGWTSDRDAEITSMMGKLIRLVDERGKAHKGTGYNKCVDALRTFGAEWKSWRTGKA